MEPKLMSYIIEFASKPDCCLPSASGGDHRRDVPPSRRPVPCARLSPGSGTGGLVLGNLWGMRTKAFVACRELFARQSQAERTHRRVRDNRASHDIIYDIHL